MFFASLLMCKVQTGLGCFTYFVRSQTGFQVFPLATNTNSSVTWTNRTHLKAVLQQGWKVIPVS